jgi:hypothetical protein
MTLRYTLDGHVHFVKYVAEHMSTAQRTSAAQGLFYEYIFNLPFMNGRSVYMACNTGCRTDGKTSENRKYSAGPAWDHTIYEEMTKLSECSVSLQYLAQVAAHSCRRASERACVDILACSSLPPRGLSFDLPPS